MSKPEEIKTGREGILYYGKELYGDKFNLNIPQDQEVYKLVYYNFLGGETATRIGADPSKGIFLSGRTGVGKSALFRIFQKMFLGTKRQFRKVTSKQLMDDAMDRQIGEQWVHEFYGKLMLDDLYIDDVGVGQADMNKYGNWMNVIADLIHERYELWVNHGIRTHISTNLPTTASPGIPSFENNFGERALDRMVEMTKFIDWKGESKRGG